MTTARTPRRRILSLPTMPGVVGAGIFWVASLRPSLLPRAWVVQAVISAICAAVGYGVGVLVGWLLGVALRHPVDPSRTTRRLVAAIVVGVGLLALIPWWIWQRDQSRPSGRGADVGRLDRPHAGRRLPGVHDLRPVRPSHRTRPGSARRLAHEVRASMDRAPRYGRRLPSGCLPDLARCRVPPVRRLGERPLLGVGRDHAGRRVPARELAGVGRPRVARPMEHARGLREELRRRRHHRHRAAPLLRPGGWGPGADPCVRRAEVSGDGRRSGEARGARTRSHRRGRARGLGRVDVDGNGMGGSDRREGGGVHLQGGYRDRLDAVLVPTQLDRLPRRWPEGRGGRCRAQRGRARVVVAAADG